MSGADWRLDWHVARVRPTREARAVEALAARGVEAFAPTERRWRRLGNGSRRRTPFRATIAPGYVFVGLDPAFKRWASVLGCAEVLRMLGGDRPVLLPQECVARARGWQRDDDPPEVQREMPRGREYGVGDLVEMLDARFEGLRATVKGLDAGEARLLARLFGGEVEMRAPIWTLARCAPHGV